MIQESDEINIRKFLLGELAEKDQERVEERLMTEAEYFDLLQVVEDELIDDRVNGELPREEQERFDAYFLSTPERHEKVKFAEAFKECVASPAPKVLRPARWRRALSSPYLRGAVAAILILGIGVVAWRTFIYQSEVSKGLASLRQAYRDQRPVEARITEFDYAPPPLTTRGGERSTADRVSVNRAERILLDEVAEHPGAQPYHALGRFYLAAREFNKAIDQFEKALKEDSNNAPIRSDLGAAYLERATANRDKPSISDLAESLEQLKRAIELDDSLLAAHFNKALCLQRMNALTLAKQAWEDYRKKDATSEWSKEAERNLQLLRDQGINNKTPEEVFQDFMSAYRQRNKAQAWHIQRQTKEMITGTMIPFQLAQRFLAANSSSQPASSNEILEAFRFAGELEEEQSGDPFFGQLAAFYSRAGRKNAAPLKQAQEALRQGYRLCLQGRYGDAGHLFETAKKLFLQGANHWESRVVDYWLAYCFSQQGELKRSSTLLAGLAQDCRGLQYHWLEAQAYCWLANNSALLSEYSNGVEQDKKALRIALSIGDSYSTQKAASQVAEDYKFLGRLREALEFNQQSLPSAEDYFVSYRQFWRSLFSITDTLFALRLYTAAEAYEQEALQLALNQFNDPALIHDTYMRLGQIYAGQENYPAASQSLELSLETLKPIANDPIGKKLFGLSALQIGHVKRQTRDYTAALDYYRKAAQEFGSSEFGLYNYNTRKGMLLCHLLNKDDRAVEQELPVVLGLYEQNRQKIREELNRNHFFDAEQDVYELAIDYEYGRGNKEQSFHYAESSRARSLQDAILGGATASNDSTTPDVIVPPVSQPLSLGQTQERLPDGLQLVEYAVLQNRLLIWVITKTRFELIQQPISIASLEAITNEYLHVLISNDAGSVEREKQLAVELHDWLFAPLTNYLDNAEEVVLIPDKFLFKIPFAALLSRESDRRVVNDYTLLYAPSATVLVICTDLARRKNQDKEAERLLSVGDPRFSRQQYPELSYLPSAAVEAKEVASFFRTKAVFIREEAFKEAIELELRQSDVIHFAAHYLADDFLASRSRLLLSPKQETKTNETSDDLSLQEIQTMRLPKARLVILSACQSGIERFYAGEGLIGLSRAFLMAGIPLVIASQWSVESDSTTSLMITFHRLRKTQDLSATRALRQAQINMLSQEDERYRRPYYWAAFFPIGGHASY
ncbi:MAG TPA: CHAT domain-containing protein [Blastocatellia bacterium]|nr:CHAT domain-containing protein [Blastocatellia bacterium]